MARRVKDLGVVINPLENHSEFVQALIARDVEKAIAELDAMQHPDAKDEYDRTPLMYAILKENDEVIANILARKPNVLTRDREGFTVLHRAAQLGKAFYVSWLIEYYEQALAHTSGELSDFIEIKSCRGVTALGSAAILGFVDVVELLLNRGANPRVKNHEGSTVLMTLAIKGHARVIEALLSHPAMSRDDIHVSNARGWTALHFASFHHQISSAEVLIRHGANPNQGDDQGMTPLMVASSEAMVAFLLRHGAYINQTTPRGESALTLALRNHQEAILKLLIEHHANLLGRGLQDLCASELPPSLHELYLQERDQQYVAFQLLLMGNMKEIYAAYQQAQQQQNHYLVEALREWIEAKKQELIEVCCNEDLYTAQELIAKGIDPMECSIYGMNLLSYALITQRPAMVNLFLADEMMRSRVSGLMRWFHHMMGYPQIAGLCVQAPAHEISSLQDIDVADQQSVLATGPCPLHACGDEQDATLDYSQGCS